MFICVAISLLFHIVPATNELFILKIEVFWDNLVCIFLDCMTAKKETLWFFKISGNICLRTQCNSTKYLNYQQHHCENFKFGICLIMKWAFKFPLDRSPWHMLSCSVSQLFLRHGHLKFAAAKILLQWLRKVVISQRSVPPVELLLP